MKNISLTMIFIFLSINVIFAQKSFEDIYLEAPDLVGQNFEIKGEIGIGKTGSMGEDTDSQYVIYDLNEPEYYKFRLFPELNYQSSNNLKLQLDWILKNCIIKKCKHTLKIEVMWAEESKVPVVKIIEIDSPKTNYKLNLNDIDATAITLFHNQITNKMIKMDIIYVGGKDEQYIFPLKYWGNGIANFDDFSDDIKSKISESVLLKYHVASKGMIAGDISYSGGRIDTKFKKIIIKKCSDSDWKRSIFPLLKSLSWKFNNSRKDCHFKISAIYHSYDVIKEMFEYSGLKSKYTPFDQGWGFSSLNYIDGPTRFFKLSEIKFLEVLN